MSGINILLAWLEGKLPPELMQKLDNVFWILLSVLVLAIIVFSDLKEHERNTNG